MNAPNQLSANEALEVISGGQMRVSTLVQSCLDRIEEREPTIHAWQYLDKSARLSEAKACDSNPTKKILHGLVVGIKDNYDTHDMPTGYGSPIYARNRPAADAAVVAQLREHGAIILGKTVSTEFASSPPPVTRNPHNPGHTPGGSSSGSAAAVADYMVPVALGTQTLGSVIRPASYCGVVGFKPSYRRISCEGIKTLAESLDTVGIFGRSVSDVELVYRVLSKTAPAQLDDYQGPTALALCRGPDWDKADSDAQSALEKFSERLRAKGIRVDDIELPESFRDLAVATRIIHDMEMWRAFSDERVRNFGLISPELQVRFESASRLSVDDYEGAINKGISCRQELPGLLKGYDAALTLSATGEAPAGIITTGDPVMNSPWSLLYTPCISIPMLQGRSGLPIGLQVIAPRFHDARALRAASWLHRNMQEK
jgi:Asp-tRNA(Asn)/Glu-tRNA(Gln) amidotransferase A subunit family amidase